MFCLQKLDFALGVVEAGTGEAEHYVEGLLAEVEDLMSYCNDIMDTGAPRIQCGELYRTHASEQDLCLTFASVCGGHYEVLNDCYGHE